MCLLLGEQLGLDDLGIEAQLGPGPDGGKLGFLHELLEAVEGGQMRCRRERGRGIECPEERWRWLRLRPCQLLLRGHVGLGLGKLRDRRRCHCRRCHDGLLAPGLEDVAGRGTLGADDHIVDQLGTISLHLGVEVGPGVGTGGHPQNVPAAHLAGEGRPLDGSGGLGGLLGLGGGAGRRVVRSLPGHELSFVLRQQLEKGRTVVDAEGEAVRQPRYCHGVGLVGQDFH